MGLLGQILGGAAGSRYGNQSGGMSPVTMALMALLAYRTYKGQGRLAEMMGRAPAANANAANPTGQSAPMSGGGLGGLIGGLLSGGATGGLLSGGLADLVRHFQDNGQGDIANSWVSAGPNKPVSPEQLEQTVGTGTLDELAKETGMPRDQLLKGLSDALPKVVDKLTPEGRLPTEQEASRFV